MLALVVVLLKAAAMVVEAVMVAWLALSELNTGFCLVQPIIISVSKIQYSTAQSYSWRGGGVVQGRRPNGCE